MKILTLVYFVDLFFFYLIFSPWALCQEYMYERVADRGGGIEKQGESIWIGKGGTSLAVLIPLCDIRKASETKKYR